MKKLFIFAVLAVFLASLVALSKAEEEEIVATEESQGFACTNIVERPIGMSSVDFRLETKFYFYYVELTCSGVKKSLTAAKKAARKVAKAVCRRATITPGNRWTSTPQPREIRLLGARGNYAQFFCCGKFRRA